jgi:WD40 repeat protein
MLHVRYVLLLLLLLQVMTSSMDGTVRIWDLNGRSSFDKLLCKTVLKVRGAKVGGKVIVTCASYCPEGKLIGCGGADGSIRLLPAAGGTGGSTAMGRYTVDSPLK